MFHGSAHTTSEVDEALEYLERWFYNPARFAYEVFGIEPWERQREMMELPCETDHFAVKTGHKVGKSTTVAILALWWAVTRDNARSAITSSSFLQVKKIIWREIKRLYQMARVPIGGKLHDDPRTGIIFPDGNEVFGFSTSEKERAAGFSSPNQLFLIDEASGGGLSEVFDAIEGNIAGGGIIGMFGNPTRTDGPFFDAFNHRRSIWKTMTVSSAESPNVKAGKVLVPGLATRPWIELRRKEWGESHPLYMIRVDGKFPRYSDSSIIPYFLIDAGQLAWRTHQFRESGEEKRHPFDLIRFEEGPVQIGLDVGRHGTDDSVIQVTRGLTALDPMNVHGLDGKELADEVLSYCERLRESGYFSRERVDISIRVDEIGVGASPYDFMRHDRRVTQLRLEVIPISAARSPLEPDRYADYNTESLFRLRFWLEQGGRIPEHPRLEKEMLFPEFEIDEKGRYRKTMPKKLERLADNLGHSPNNRDALAMAVYPVRRAIHDHISDGARATGVHVKTSFVHQGEEEDVSLMRAELRPGSVNPYINNSRGWVSTFTRR